jgi:hypothetical protein
MRMTLGRDGNKVQRKAPQSGKFGQDSRDDANRARRPGYFHWQATKDGLMDQEEVKEYINKREDECSEANKL